MDDFSESDRPNAIATDVTSLTKNALKQTRRVMRDSKKLLDRTRDRRDLDDPVAREGDNAAQDD